MFYVGSGIPLSILAFGHAEAWGTVGLLVGSVALAGASFGAAGLGFIILAKDHRVPLPVRAVLAVPEALRVVVLVVFSPILVALARSAVV